MKKGFVLVPGAGMSDWVWMKMIPLLKYDSVTVSRRLSSNNYENRMKASFDDVIKYASEIIRESGFDEVILVCHSGAGLLGGMLGKSNSKVKHVVFIAANIPKHMNTAISVFPEEIQKMNIEAVKAQAVNDSIPMKALEIQFRNFFCNTSSEEDIAYIMEQDFLPEPICVINETMDWTDYPKIGLTYVVCTEDKTLSVDNQKILASNLNIQDIRLISSDHMVMISHSTELADVLNSL